MNRLLDVVTAPWAILPAKLSEIVAAYDARMLGEQIDLQAVAASLGRPLGSEPQDYEIVDGVAIIPMMGTIARRANLFSDISGGASSDLVMRDLRSAAANSRVNSILLHADTPGGTVAGTQQTANVMREVGAVKPVVTLGDGLIASAGYWIGAAAQAVFIADGTTQVGSIGVVSSHRDVSRSEEMRGVKTTEIYAGKYKRIAGSYAPLSEEGRASVQDYVDYLYGQFVQAVAEYRGVSTEKVLADMADGRIFVGQQAVDAGLVDGIATLDQLVGRLAAGEFKTPGAAVPRPKTRADMPTSPKGNSMSITTRDELAAESPALLQEIESAARAAGEAAGATAERARILGIEAHAMVGHEALIASLKADGKTTPDQAAAQVLGAHRAALAKQASGQAAEAPPPLPASVDASAGGKKDAPTKAQIAARAAELRREAEANGGSLSYAAAATQAAKELAHD
ncbi:S49 family peptidase [Cupriavidus sp. 30B13]|uniref:S49 family peptidase n=1 Tax=Cupriavidus sp. 30B13 TaxID=3384241 RepID=UPI003B8EB699